MEGKTIGRIAALDGLRGVAVLLVIIYHAWPQYLPGGAYGVTVFFVLSGFLITGLLTRADIDYRRFYWNRAVRLLPALVVLLVVYGLVVGRWGDVGFAFTYTSNFALVADVHLGGLAHTWSLAVEEHFYLLWPVILGWMRPGQRLRTTSILLALAVIWRMVLLVSGANHWRAYAATDALAFALLAGCLLAILHSEGRLRVPGRAVTLAAVAGIIALSMTLPALSTTAAWAMFAVVALSAVAIAGCLRPVRLLSHPWLVWFGTISYGLYLWHVPVIWFGDGARSLLLGLSVILAGLSFYLVEQPMRRRFHSHAEVGLVDPEVVDGVDRVDRGVQVLVPQVVVSGGHRP